MTLSYQPAGDNPAPGISHPNVLSPAGSSLPVSPQPPPLAGQGRAAGANQPITARFSAACPCPVCGTGSKGCSATADGLHLCRGKPGDGWRQVSYGQDDHGFRYYRRAGDGRASGRPHPDFRPTPPKDWHAAVLLFVAALTPALRAELAAGLHLPAEALTVLPLLGWSEGEGCWTFAEQDAAGGVVGVTRRFRDGRKRVMRGGHRGLTLAAGWRERAGPVFVVEGASDVLAMTHAGLSCVGRPSNTGGAGLLVALLATLPADREIVVVGENDVKRGGGWPGREGMRVVAGKLAAALRRPVLAALPPAGVKDVREWLTSADRGGNCWGERGRELSALLLDNAVPVNPPAAPPPPPSPPPVPEYVPFPVECLPERVQPFVRQVAAATNTDPAFTALPLLSLLGAVVGSTRAIMPKRGWLVFPTIWACVVGRSASGKSPALRAVQDALAPLIEELEDSNRAAREEYERAKATYISDRSKKRVPLPPEPQPRRVRVGDTTVEALAAILHHNPRGVWLAADELAGWFGSFTRYRGSRDNTDRPKWLSLFDGGCLEVDRRTGEPRHISVRNTMVGVAGGIQPGILRDTMTEENVRSGLFARILLAYPPDRLPRWSEVEVTDHATDDLTCLLRALRGYGLVEQDGRLVPVLNILDADAKALFVAFFNTTHERAFTADDAEAAATVKLEAYALKFAHLRHLCRHAGGDDSAPVSADDMAAGITLAGWFRCEWQRVRALLAEPERMQGNRRLAAWIRGKGGAVTVRQLQKTDHRRYPRVEDARARLEALAADGFGEWVDAVAGNGRTVTRFVLHPDPTPPPGHHQTPPSPGVGQAPDTPPTEVAESPGFPGETREVSGSVWRRDGEPTPGDNNGGQTPQTVEASATPGGVATPPVWSDADQFFTLASRAGVAWPAVLDWLNERIAAGLPPDTGFFRVPVVLRSAAADWLAQTTERSRAG